MKKILIIRFSSIGDIVLTSPVIRCLKTQLPDAELHVLTMKANRLLFEHNPYISRIHSFEGSFSILLPALRAERYDHIVDLHKNLRSLRVKLALGVTSRSFPKLNLKKYLLVRFKLNMMPQLHIVDRYFKAVECLGVANDQQGLDYYLPADQSAFEKVKGDFSVEKFPQGFVAVVIGAKHFTKILPVDKVIDVCRQVKLPVVLVGGREDAGRGEQIASAQGLQAFNACGKYGLHESAMIVKLARSVVANDTGLMHIAAAFRKPIVSVWGNTVPDFGMYPYMPTNPDDSVMFSIKNIPCRPCSKIGYQRCPKGHFDCMMKHNSSDIAATVNGLIR